MNRFVAWGVLLGLGALAQADTAPHRKPGLWLIVTRPNDSTRKPQTSRLCIDHDTERLIDRLAAGTLQLACTEIDVRVSGARVTTHAVCSVGGQPLSADAVTTFSDDTHYHADLHMGETRTSQQGTWVSDCPGGTAAGDMLITDSRGREMRTNLRKLLQLP